MTSEFYTIEQVSETLGIHQKTVRRYIGSGKISAQKIGGSWRINPDSLNIFLESCDTNTRSKNELSKDDFCIFMDSEYFNSDESLQVCSIVDCFVSNENVKELLKDVMAIVADYTLESKKCRFNYVYDDVESKIRFVFWGTPSFMYSIMDIAKNYE